MFDKASLKLGLDRAVLQAMNRRGNTNGVRWSGAVLNLQLFELFVLDTLYFVGLAMAMAQI